VITVNENVVDGDVTVGVDDSGLVGIVWTVDGVFDVATRTVGDYVK
jgi:hypothetical protein